MAPARTGTSRTKRNSTARAGTNSRSDASGEEFTFSHPDTGEPRHLPIRIPFGVLRKALKAGGDMEQMIAILEQVADPDALDAIDAMDISDVNALVARWQEAIGASLGDT